MIVHILTRLYHASLRFYPRKFRSEFAEEMSAVFAQALEEAAARGALAIGRLCLAELAGFACAVLQNCRAAEHSRTSGALEGPGRELVLALAVFLLPAGMVLYNGEPQEVRSLPAAVLFVGVMIVVGWLGGFPLWSRPYIGIILVVASYLHLFQWVTRLVWPALLSNLSPRLWDPGTYLLLKIASTGMVWLMLFCLTLLVVALLAVFNRFQPLMARVRHDWTQLSYVLYGESVFALVLLFGNHRSEPNYVIASLMCLLAGVWFYLRSPSRWQRLLALLTCLTLAVWVAVLEGNQMPPPVVGRLLLAWGWMVAALLLPSLLARLPKAAPPPAAGPLSTG